MTRIIAIVVVLLAALAGPARADFTFTQGTGATGFSFTAATGGTALCAASVTHCFASVPINTAGSPIFTAAIPGQVTGANGTFPVTGTLTAVTTVTNLAQMNGAALLMGQGATGTGSQRVTLANDNTIPTGWPTAANQTSVIGTKAPGTAAASAVLGGCVYTSGGVTLTTGQQVADQCDANGNRLVSGVGVAVGSTTSGQTGSLVMGATTTAAPTYTTAQTNPISLTLTGDVRTVFSNTTIAVTATNLPTNVAQINGVTPLMGTGNTGTGSPRVTLPTDQVAIATWGQGALAATAPSGATQSGCVGKNVEQTAVTDGQMTAVTCGLGGKQIVLPFTVKELAVRGKGTATASTGAITIVTAGSGSNKTYITDWECSNTSGTNVTVTFNDSASTQFIVPATGGNNKGLQIPLVTAAATAFTFASDTSVTSVICNAQGYYAL